MSTQVKILLVGILAVLPVAAHAQESSEADSTNARVAKRFTLPEGHTLPPSSHIAEGREPEDAAVRDAGYILFPNNPVLYTGPSWFSGPQEVSVYASDVHWYYTYGATSAITSPEGRGGAPAGSGWRYPGCPEFSIVVYQNNFYWCITSTDPNAPDSLERSGGGNVWTTVNDTNDGYADNGGSYGLYVRPNS